MPIEVISGTTPRPRGGGLVVQPSVPKSRGTPIASSIPVQVIGFIPLMSCTDEECRQPPVDCCWVNEVYGNLVSGAGGTQGESGPSYENDVNTFMVDYQLYTANPNATATWVLQKCVNNEWVDKATLNSSVYGVHYPFKFFSTHKSYTGYQINWGKVLKNQGVGCYRIKLTTKLDPTCDTPDCPLDICQISKQFQLKKWNCNQAHYTVKFECWKTGKIGNINKDGQIVDLCKINYYDSIRCPGFFGKRTIGEYLKIIHELPNSETHQIRNEAVPEYKFLSGMLPFWMHTRMQIHMMMADTTLVSDYNINNSDYTIRRRFVIGKGAYKPNYYEDGWNRLQDVEVDFDLGYHGLIASSCCDDTK
jgi:hypothetical protein